MSDTCDICGASLVQSARGPEKRFCSARCRKIAQRKRQNDWTRGMKPIRIERFQAPAVRPGDLEAVAIVQQRGVFGAARELSHVLPAERAWRWKRWLSSMPEFESIFGEPDA